MLLLMLTLPPRQAVSAFSTAKEIAQSTKIDQEIVAEQSVVHDPLLTAWVQRTAKHLWAHVHRTDVPYSVKILDSTEINAFTTGGGFLYLDEGVLDTVASDDELAGVIGHETGHDEHRHPIVLRQRGELLSIIFGLASLISPGLAALGSFAGQGMLAKTSRSDEYQADTEGLHFLVKSGYDPEAMVSLMQRLNDLEADTDSHVDRYLADHPGLLDRIKRMEAASEIARQKTDDHALFLAALHDEATARYAVARVRFARLHKLHPEDTTVLWHLARMESYLGDRAHAAQYATAAQEATDQSVKLQARQLIEQLRDNQRRSINFRSVDLQGIRARLIQVHHDIQNKANTAAAVRELARATIASVTMHIKELSAKAPSSDSSVDEHLARQLSMLGRTINLVVDHATTVIDGVGTLKAGREEGLFGEALSLNRQFAGLVATDDIPPEERLLLQSYPHMADELLAGNEDIMSATRDADQALLQLHQGLNSIGQVFRDVEHGTKPNLPATQAELSPALERADAATREYNRARSRYLSLRIALLNIGAFPDRRAGLDAALTQRLALPQLPPLVSRPEVNAGDIAVAQILGADAGIDPAALLMHARRSHRLLLDLPEVAHVDTQAVEILLGLVYLDYTDDAATREFAAKEASR